MEASTQSGLRIVVYKAPVPLTCAQSTPSWVDSSPVISDIANIQLAPGSGRSTQDK